jgi:hypothetical protein
MRAHVSTRLFNGILLAFAVWELASAAVRTCRFLVASAGFSVNACELDSFSQASVASAALEQEDKSCCKITWTSGAKDAIASRAERHCMR